MTANSLTPAGQAFVAARDFVLRHRADFDTAVREFRWPALEQFNWALDYFDPMAADNHRPALHIVDEDGTERFRSFAEMAARSNQVATLLRALDVQRGDRVLLMLGNEIALWECWLALMKLGAVVSPAAGLLTPADLQDRIDRGGIRHIIAGLSQVATIDSLRGTFSKLLVGGRARGWTSFEEAAHQPSAFTPIGPTNAQDPLLLYFTSGTTAQPKMVLHSHQSYPVGHLSTLFFAGLQPGDRHWNISSPGWAKHAWSCLFAPWNAEATVFIYDYARFDATAILRVLVTHGVTTLCAPPTVWRMLMHQPLADYRVALRELLSAGEPLNPDVIAQVRAAWGLTIRDGYGQTETTALIGNPPGTAIKPGRWDAR